MMAPSSTKTGSENSSKMNLKRLWKKFVSPKEKKKDRCKDDYVFDSVPDYVKEPQPDKLSNSYNKNTSCRNEHSFSETEDDFSKDEEPVQGEMSDEDSTTKEKDENVRSSQKPKGEEKRTRTSSPAAEKNVTTNVTCYNGSVQIGNTNIYNYSQQINMTSHQRCDIGKSKKKETNEKMPLIKTQQIQELMDSKVRLRNDHIQFLSKHFGKKYREIAGALELTSGLVDKLEVSCGDTNYELMAFEILKLWKQNVGDKATVGKLCRRLWKSNIWNAREAVKKFSEKWESFDKDSQ